MQRILFTLLLLLLTKPLLAFELFGTNINNTDRDQLRGIIRNTGANVVREAGDDNWYDIYDMSAKFEQGKRLFVGYEKTAGRFAFAEYQLPYDYFDMMLLRLKAKYGEPVVRYGRYDSDKLYAWNIDGIDIRFTQDWNRNISQLVYSQPENLIALKQGYQQFKAGQFSESLKTKETYF